MLDRTKQDPCGERLLAVIVNELQIMQEAGYHVGNYYELGLKLLTENYYKESEELMQKVLTEKDLSPEDTDLFLNQAAAKHTQAYKTKMTDYLTLFSAIGLNIEEWCDVDA